MPASDPLPEDPTPVAQPVDPESSDLEPADAPPPPRDISGLIGPTLVGMVAGVAIILLILWLT